MRFGPSRRRCYERGVGLPTIHDRALVLPPPAGSAARPVPTSLSVRLSSAAPLAALLVSVGASAGRLAVELGGLAPWVASACGLAIALGATQLRRTAPSAPTAPHPEDDETRLDAFARWLRALSGGGAALAGIGIASATALTWPWWLQTPQHAWVVGLSVIVVAFDVFLSRSVTQPAGPGWALTLALLLGALAWFVAGWASPTGALVLLPAGITWAVVMGHWVLRALARQGWRHLVPLSIVALAAAHVALVRAPALREALFAGAMAHVAAAVLTGVLSADGREVLLRPVLLAAGHPATLLLSSFGALCSLGTLLLLAVGTRPGHTPLDVVDAAFTAVSASCVTGLVVRDTGGDFGFVGQAVILLLIQVGGLGIMTLSSAALAAMGRRISLRHERVLGQVLGEEHRAAVFQTLRRIVVVTAASELLGAALLFALFAARGIAPGTAAWKAVFTAISAFCNAGFALDADSLMWAQRDPLILHVVATLIVIGGLSPAAIAAIPHRIRRRPVPTAVRMVWWASASLLFVGFVLFAVVEWNGVLADLPILDRFHNAWFQSVTLRTAGFNSVDIARVHPATRTWMLLWMFIGGSPGGTAGGIKTTTVVVLLAAAWSGIRGRREPVLFGRVVSRGTVVRALAVTLASSLVLFTGLMAVQLTQDIDDPVALFEVVSALGTVGLSQGATPHLDGVGRIVIIACMFAGRVGPLTIFYLVAQRLREPPSWYPRVDIQVG